MSKGYKTALISSFEHTISGVPYTIEAEILYAEKENFPASRDDCYDEFVVEEFVVLDKNGVDFSDTLIIPDNVLKNQLFVQSELAEEEDLEGLNIRHIASEVRWYYE